MVSRIQREGVLAGGIGLDEATDLMWGLASIQLWDALIEERGWTVERYRRHLKRVLAAVPLR